MEEAGNKIIAPMKVIDANKQINIYFNPRKVRTSNDLNEVSTDLYSFKV